MLYNYFLFEKKEKLEQQNETGSSIAANCL